MNMVRRPRLKGAGRLDRRYLDVFGYGSTQIYNCHDELYEFGGQCVVALNAEAVTLRPNLRWILQICCQFTGRQPIACAGSCYLTGGGTSRKALDGKQKESPAN